MKNEKTAVIILAAGNGSRMGENKLFLEIDGKPVLAHAISAFYDLGFTGEIVVALKEGDYELFEEKIRRPYHFDRVKVVTGGEDRQESAYKSLAALNEDTDYVLIHDGARPFPSEELIMDCLNKTREFGAATSALPARDTVKVSENGETIDYTPDRRTLFEAQTPQGFKYDLIVKANEKRCESAFPATDDSSIAEHAGYPVALSKGEKINLKITTPDDLVYAEALAQLFKRGK